MNILTVIEPLPILAFMGLIIAAAVIDLRSLTIPNKISLAIALIYPAHVIASGGSVDWVSGLLVGMAVLTGGFVLFTCKLIGGGDAKLLAAASLWAGPALISPLLLFTALGGGAIAIAMWLHHRYTRAATVGMILHSGTDPDFAKRDMAYGVAIAVGAIYVALTLLREV